MAQNLKKVAILGKGAKAENKVINSNPGYIFRSLNKKAQGRDNSAKEVEGYSIDNLKELFKRLNDTFAGGGFWWSSIYAVNGRPVTSLSLLTDAKAYYLDPSFTPDDDHVLIHFAGAYYLGTLGQWSENAVIDAAKARLQLVEKYAEAIDSQEEKERKAQEKEERKAERKAENKRKAQERKEEKEKAQELTKTIQELKAKVAAGALTMEEAAAQVAAALAA